MNYQTSSYSDNIQKVIKNASKFALRFGSNLIGSEHILYGLASVKDCLASKFLMEFQYLANYLKCNKFVKLIFYCLVSIIIDFVDRVMDNSPNANSPKRTKTDLKSRKLT